MQIAPTFQGFLAFANYAHAWSVWKYGGHGGGGGGGLSEGVGGEGFAGISDDCNTSLSISEWEILLMFKICILFLRPSYTGCCCFLLQ
jgi:hypothetical protein